MPSVNQIVTDRIIEKMQQGKIVWQNPYLCKDGFAAMNYQSKRPYTSINALLLSDPECPFYLTFNQIQKLGGKVRKGAKSDIAVFWKIMDYADVRQTSTGSDLVSRKVPLLRYYNVFNLKHVDNIAWKQELDFSRRANVNPIAEAESLLNRLQHKPKIVYTDMTCAYYSPTLDYVNVPPAEFVASDSAWYCMHFHELAHSTGHPDRLNRELTGRSSTNKVAYSKEELIAEITTTFLANSCGLTQEFDNSVAYIQGWLKALKNDPNMIISAAAQAQKAYDYMLGNVKEQEQEEAAAMVA